MTRFFVKPEEVTGDRMTLSAENAHHARVLRLMVGEEVLVCDGQGVEWRCRVSQVQPEVRLEVLERQEQTGEPLIRVSIYMAFAKSDKLEHVIQKATELGAYEIIAFPSARCVAKPDGSGLEKKLDRWRRIATSAAEQSGRGRIPDITALPSFSAALERASQADLALLFYENEHALTLHDALLDGEYASISLLTGPEGGLEPYEVEQARAAGLRVCTLGRRILRCETAPLCALSAVMYASGEF